ncbi:MAG: cytidine deaminase [Bacteroidota bacterium]
MRIKELKILVHEFDAVVELPENDQQLLLAAREACNSAYAPYSKFQVGAAVELENGVIVKGNNQENADFTDGLCAERVALFFAHATYPDVPVKSIAISARNVQGLLEEPAQPCGSCRQVFVETESRYKKPMRIILDGRKHIQVLEGADNLLPLAFKPGALDT